MSICFLGSSWDAIAAENGEYAQWRLDATSLDLRSLDYSNSGSYG